MIKSASKIASTLFTQNQYPAGACLCALVIATVCALLQALAEASSDPLRYRGGLRNSLGLNRLNEKELAAVLDSLREKSGLQELHFGPDGFLSLGDQTKFAGGSATARALLAAAVSTPHAIDLETHNHSSTVAFARLAQAVSYFQYSTGKKIEVYPLEIDFRDLLHLRGDRDVLAAFDLGFVILHELGHAALGLRDALGGADRLGECEEFINRIRRELHLPERQAYIARVQTIRAAGHSTSAIKEAELSFTRLTEKKGQEKSETVNLRWEAMKVGPIVDLPVQSVARMRNQKPVTASVAGQ